MKTNFFKKAIVLLLALVLAIPVVIGVETKADEKPQLSDTEMTIGRGSYGMPSDDFVYHKKNDRYILSVENSKKGATYTFKSSDKKVVTVKTNKSGTKGYLF